MTRNQQIIKSELERIAKRFKDGRNAYRKEEVLDALDEAFRNLCHEIEEFRPLPLDEH